MDILRNPRVRLMAISGVILLESLGYFLPWDFGVSAIYFSYGLLIPLSFLAISVRHAAINGLLAATAAPVLTLLIIWLLTTIKGANSEIMLESMETALYMYSMVLISVVPYIAVGYGLRILVQRIW